jgi:radical SAM protein with 4Fe4S-binding SPASM domain
MLDIKLKLRPGHTTERSWMEPSPLRQLFWNVTYACNFACPVCFTDAGEPQPDELSTDEALEVAQRAGEAGVKDIIISGGEPFMRTDLPDILARMAQLNVTARIASNGSLLTDDVLSRLKDETLTRSFQISLDTLDPKLYARIHGTDASTFHTALRALARIKDHGFHTTVSVRLTPETLPGIPSLIDRASAEGWATVTVHCPVHTRRTSSVFPQDADVFGLLEPALNHFAGLSERWLIETYIPWAQYHPVMRRLARNVRLVHRGCRAGRDRLTINPTGLLSPCVCMDVPEAHVGNVRTDALVDVFRDSPICQMLRRPQEYGICTECGNVDICGGGCRSAALVLTGRIDGQDESCPVWQRRSATAGAGTHGTP